MLFAEVLASEPRPGQSVKLPARRVAHQGGHLAVPSDGNEVPSVKCRGATQFRHEIHGPTYAGVGILLKCRDPIGGHVNFR